MNKEEILKIIKNTKGSKKKALERDDFKCRLCNTKENLQCHHLLPKKLGGNNLLLNLITVCESCHLFLHCNPKIMILQKLNHSNSTKIGMVLARRKGKRIGRPKKGGSKK